MKEKWKLFKESLAEITSMSKREFLLTIAVCILGGIVFGLMFSPRKNTMIGSNNGNNSGNNSGSNNGNGSRDSENQEEEGEQIADSSEAKQQ